MKNLFIIMGCAVLLLGCAITQDGIVIDKPTVPTVSICANVASDADVTGMVNNIESQTFKDEKLARARLVTNDHCFVSQQVVRIMEAFDYEDNKLTMAKELYHQTTDKSNYTIVVDALTYKSDRDELINYIQTHS